MRVASIEVRFWVLGPSVAVGGRDEGAFAVVRDYKSGQNTKRWREQTQGGIEG